MSLDDIDWKAIGAALGGAVTAIGALFPRLRRASTASREKGGNSGQDHRISALEERMDKSDHSHALTAKHLGIIERRVDEAAMESREDHRQVKERLENQDDQLRDIRAILARIERNASASS